MNNRQLEYFITIVNEGNIANAARALYISDSALSQLIKKLEEEVGARLFIRTRNAMQLSFAGRKLYEYALATVQGYRQLIHTFKDSADICSGDLILSLSVKRAISLLPILLPPYIKRYPNVQIKTIADMFTVDERERCLLEGKYDFIINSYHNPNQYHSSDMEYIQIGTERVILFLGKETKLAQKLVKDGQPPAFVRLEDIADEGFLLPSPAYGGRYMVDSMFAQINRKPRILAQVSPVCVSKSMVETGHFCTLSAEIYKDGSALTAKSENCYTIPVWLTPEMEPYGSRPIYLIYKKSMSLVSFQQSFIQMAVDLLSETNSLN